MAYGKIFTALADPTRRDIFEALRACPKSVGELAEMHPVSRPAVSQHLKVLQSANLVDVEPQGTKRLYRIKREGLNELRAYLDEFWSDALFAYANEITSQMNNKE